MHTRKSSLEFFARYLVWQGNFLTHGARMYKRTHVQQRHNAVGVSLHVRCLPQAPASIAYQSAMVTSCSFPVTPSGYGGCSMNTHH